MTISYKSCIIGFILQRRKKMNKIYNYFKEINKLNEIIRTGWLWRDVSLDRLESVSEHIFTTALLALAVIDKYHLQLNVEKVLRMILIHEIGEIDVGDIPVIDVERRKNKHESELKCVNRVAEVINEPWIAKLWNEFEEGKTEEAKFVFKMDKLGAVMQAKYYSELLHDNKLFDEFYNNAVDLCGEFIEVAE